MFLIIAQPEQAAVDFYAKKILPKHYPYSFPYWEHLKHRKPVIRYDGNIRPISEISDLYGGNFAEFGYGIIRSYYWNKAYPISGEANHDSIFIDRNDIKRIESSIIKTNIVKSKTKDSLKLYIPRGIHKKKKLVFKRKRDEDQLSSLPYKIWELLTRPKSNMEVYPAVFYDNYYYVQITVSHKTFLNRGSGIWIKMTTDFKIIDWAAYMNIP